LKFPTGQAKGEGTLIRGLMNSIAFAGFVLLLPVFGLMAWFVLCAVLDHRDGLRGNLLPPEIRCGDVMNEKRELTPAALYELFERHSQCVFDQSGKCPLLVFTQQMCWEINEFFNGEENENAGRRRRNPPRTFPLS
jgi:hypothetical protein